MASHHVSRALNLCNRALILHQGRLSFDQAKQSPGQVSSTPSANFYPAAAMTLLRADISCCCERSALELRRRDSLLTMFFFGTLLLFVFHFAFDLPPDKIAEMAPALLWLAFLFTGTLGLGATVSSRTRQPLS